jgi:hypothetical protein
MPKRGGDHMGDRPYDLDERTRAFGKAVIAF